MVVGENKRTNIMDGIENTGDVRLHDHRLRLKQRFDIVRKLGQGTYGKVQLGINKKTGQEVAIKTIKKCKIESEADLVRIRREVQIMSSVRHPNIVHIYEVFENSEKMILVMEYCSGGELYDYLSQKKVLQEEEARRLFRQIATAVYYCHIHKICHRDLKLENVLLDDTGSAKIADFGLSNVFKETSLLSTFCGSPLYASPEIVKGTPYIGPEVDCWSLGVLLYTLVYGAMPFDGSNFKRLVRQISNGDYYEPKNPSTASPLIRDMLTVDPLKRADIVYICDNPWVNQGCPSSCLEQAEALAAQTPVRLDLLLSLAPAASASRSVVVPQENELGPEESCTDLTSSASMAVEPSNSAEKRILELVAEGGEDAIKPSPTRTLVAAPSASQLRNKERVASSIRIPSEPSVESLPEDSAEEPPQAQPADSYTEQMTIQPSLKSSATITITASPKESPIDIKEPPQEPPKDEVKEKPSPVRPRVSIKKKVSPPKVAEDKLTPDKQEETKEEAKPSSVATAADKLTSLSIAQPAANQSPTKPKKLSIPGGNVGSFKEQFERRASLTSGPEVKRTLSKPVVSKIAKTKAQSEDRELPSKTSDNGTVRLQQIGIQPSPTLPSDMSAGNTGGVKKTESEPTHSTTAVDPSVLLQDARRSLQNSMAKLVEEKAGEETRRRAARDIISTAIRTGKPPMAYGRSSSAGVTSLGSPPTTPPVRSFRTEATHRVPDHRNRGLSVERIIPIHVSEEGPGSPATPPTPATAPPKLAPLKTNQVPLRRLVSSESGTGTGTGSEACSSPGEPIKKSAREFIIPIAVEGKGYVTPRQRSLEPEASSPAPRPRPTKHRRISSLVSGGESEEEGESHMHRLRSSRAARAESVSSGEEEEDDEGFHLLTADNLFSTLLHRVRALTNRLNGEEGPGFPQHPHSLFNNFQSAFFNRPHTSRPHNSLRDGWDFGNMESMFNKRAGAPRGNSKKSSKLQSKAQQKADTNVDNGLDLSDLDLSSIQLSEKEMEALSGLTPALSRRLQKQLLAQLPPAAARTLRRTLSMQNTGSVKDRQKCMRSHSASKYIANESNENSIREDSTIDSEITDNTDSISNTDTKMTLNVQEQEPTVSEKDYKETKETMTNIDVVQPQYSTLPRSKRSTISRESTPPITSVTDNTLDLNTKLNLPGNKDSCHSRGSSIRSTPDRSLLSKYLTPERTVSLEESYSSDSGSILSEPSYIAAYGSPALSGLGLRRHSMRLSTDLTKKRISRFLRPDFFDTPQDESMYAKHKKEKELETQKVLKEIRDKKNKNVDCLLSPKSPSDSSDLQQLIRDDNICAPRKCLSPTGILSGKERSRSNTPFFPILDNIKETALDTTLKNSDIKQKSENTILKESKLVRPKSFPIKTEDTVNQHNEEIEKGKTLYIDADNKKNFSVKDSKLLRPRSYPVSSLSPSPEQLIVNRSFKKENFKLLNANDDKTDVEVSFNVSLPKKKINETKKHDICKKADELNIGKDNSKVLNETSLDQNETQSLDKIVSNIKQLENTKESNLESKNSKEFNVNDEPKAVINNKIIKTEDEKLTKQNSDADTVEKKATIKKKIIRKVSSKSKSDSVTQEKLDKTSGEKKKVVKKPKEKLTDENVKNSKDNVIKKKSVLQSIGQKFEKFTSTKSNSPDKDKLSGTQVSSNKPYRKESFPKISRNQREHSVPVQTDTTTESNLIKRAVTLTDVAALDNQSAPNKTTVSKVLGLFKKFEPKEKINKTEIKPKANSEIVNANINNESTPEIPNNDADKPKRPTSLLLNGLGLKNKYGRTTSDSVSVLSMPNCTSEAEIKREDNKNLRSSLKLDFSKLPRVKKIVPTNPVIEPQIINNAVIDKETEKNMQNEKEGADNIDCNTLEAIESRIRARSRTKSDNSNTDQSKDVITPVKDVENSVNNTETATHHPHRNHETTTPEKEDIVDRIRRKSFYTRFNEKRQRRKSSLVGPGATEYDPVARLHSQSTESKYDSPTSPVNYDLSPGFSSVASDLSPSSDRYRSLLTDIPVSTRGTSRFDNYAYGHDKIDSYRSLDRNDVRKYQGSKSYLDYDSPSIYGNHRYARTLSLLDNSDETDESNLSHLREPHKYNRTLSLYAPGSYATYRPKRIRNSAIILKESEKEPSPENILDKIRQKKISISVTRKPDPDKDPQPRSNLPSKSEGDRPECPEKVD